MRVRVLTVVAGWVAGLVLVSQALANHTHSNQRALGFGQVSYGGHGPEAWANVAERRGRRIRELQQLVRRRVEPSYEQLIAVASVVYRVSSSTLERKARCESVNFTDFYNEGSGASNVFQFLPSTWRTTPFGRFSIFDPVAAVFAGAWMHAEGRGGEWVCR